MWSIPGVKSPRTNVMLIDVNEVKMAVRAFLLSKLQTNMDRAQLVLVIVMGKCKCVAVRGLLAQCNLALRNEARHCMNKARDAYANHIRGRRRRSWPLAIAGPPPPPDFVNFRAIKPFHLERKDIDVLPRSGGAFGTSRVCLAATKVVARLKYATPDQMVHREAFVVSPADVPDPPNQRVPKGLSKGCNGPVE